MRGLETTRFSLTLRRALFTNGESLVLLLYPVEEVPTMFGEFRELESPILASPSPDRSSFNPTKYMESAENVSK